MSEIIKYIILCHCVNNSVEVCTPNGEDLGQVIFIFIFLNISKHYIYIYTFFFSWTFLAHGMLETVLRWSYTTPDRVLLDPYLLIFSPTSNEP